MHSSLLLHVSEWTIGSCILQSLQGQNLSQVSGSIIKIRKELLDCRVASDFSFHSNSHLHFGFYCNPKMLGYAILTSDSELVKGVPGLIFEITLQQIFFELWVYMEIHNQVITSQSTGNISCIPTQNVWSSRYFPCRFPHCLQWKFHMRSESRLICRRFCSSFCHKITRTRKALLRKYQSASLMTIKKHKMSPEQQQHLFNCQHILKDLMQPLWLPSRKNKGTENHFLWALEQQRYNLFLNNPSL